MVRIVAIGDNDVDCYLSTRQMYPGGNCLNVAVMAQRYGATASYIGAVADDPAGRLIQDVLALENVSSERLRVEKGMTAYCVIDHKDSDRIFLNYDVGVSHFIPSQADIAYLGKFDAAHVGHTSGLDQFVPQFAQKTRISYDFSTRANDILIEKMAPFIWLATVSAGDIDEKEAIALMEKIQGYGVSWVLATRGSEGALLRHEDKIWQVRPVAVDAVDTLGAGDTMIARLLTGLLQGENPPLALSQAASAAAQTCTYYGAIGHGRPIDIPVCLSSIKSVSI